MQTFLQEPGNVDWVLMWRLLSETYANKLYHLLASQLRALRQKTVMLGIMKGKHAFSGFGD